jgi:hypothetical protein
MISGKDLFEECLAHPEPLIDPAYCTDALIISAGADQAPTPIMKTASKLSQRITAYSVASSDGDEQVLERQVVAIEELLLEPDANFLEFTSFWPSLDVSYSSYSGLEYSERLAFLRTALKIFVDKRHNIYLAHGYSPTTIQVRRDFESHKRRGNAAAVKISNLLESAGFLKTDLLDNLLRTPKTFGLFGSGEFQKGAVAVLEDRLGMDFAWHREHQGKIPDFILHSSDGTVLIGEAKHMKEVGGGQDKQVSELIALISQVKSGKRSGFVAYLDGIYFNSFLDAGDGKGKAGSQVRQIREALSREPRNYFLNSYGFYKLINQSK